MSIDLLIFNDSFLEAVKVELIFNEVFIDFAEEAVVLQAAEPLDPAYVCLLAEFRLFTHNYDLYVLNLIQIMFLLIGHLWPAVNVSTPVIYLLYHYLYGFSRFVGQKWYIHLLKKT